MNPKQRAAEAALSYITSGMTLGLGTGSTAKLFIDALGAAMKENKLSGIRGVPTSNASETQARGLGIPIVALAQAGRIDIDVDGADEVDPHLNLIKGLGGALLREKIIAQNSKQMIVICDSSKRVETMGTHAPLPVEVTPFEHEMQAKFIQTLGAQPVLRCGADGKPFVTDNGNYIYDCRFNGISDPSAVQERLKSRAGIVETGLFLDLATVALIADGKGVETLKRSG
jgi:ribose 5-phosphate isomerase A